MSARHKWSAAVSTFFAHVSPAGGLPIDDGLVRNGLNHARVIVARLESAGVEFIAENGGDPGVRLKKTAIEEISQEIDALEDKISSMPVPTVPSPA